MECNVDKPLRKAGNVHRLQFLQRKEAGSEVRRIVIGGS
jgi:hypothetical protein